MEQAFVHLSDPHLSSLETVTPAQIPNKRILGYLSWKRKRRFEHRREVLDTLVDHLHSLAPEQIVLTGDLTHIGMPDEFRQAAEWLRLLGTPEQVSLVPGNHECYVAQPRELGFAQWDDYLPAGGGSDKQWPSLRVCGQIAFIGLSSACPTPPLMASGTLGQRQLERLGDILRETREQGLMRVVYLHHSPLPGAEKWRKRLTDAGPLSSLLSEEGAELILHGHGHRFRSHHIDSETGTIPVLAVPSASARGLYGADVARYHHIGVETADGGWKLRVQAYCYQTDQAVMAPGESLEFILERAHAPS